jgi:hypothetical protein
MRALAVTGSAFALSPDPVPPPGALLTGIAVLTLSVQDANKQGTPVAQELSEAPCLPAPGGQGKRPA